MTMNKAIIIWIAIFATVGVPLSVTYASNENPYDSGYNHGCDESDQGF